MENGREGNVCCELINIGKVSGIVCMGCSLMNSFFESLEVSVFFMEYNKLIMELNYPNNRDLLDVIFSRVFGYHPMINFLDREQ